MANPSPADSPTAAAVPESLADRLARLEDIEAARALLHRYAIAVDTQGSKEIAALWTDDGVLATRLGDFVGTASIIGFYDERFAIDSSRKRHFVAEPLLTWQGPGRVRNTCYFMYTAQTPESSMLGWGIYDDVIVVTDGVASFERRQIQVVAVGDPTQGWPLKDS